MVVYSLVFVYFQFMIRIRIDPAISKAISLMVFQNQKNVGFTIINSWLDYHLNGCLDLQGIDAYIYGVHHKNLFTWENRAPKDWQVAFVPWWCRVSPFF